MSKTNCAAAKFEDVISSISADVSPLDMLLALSDAGVDPLASLDDSRAPRAPIADHEKCHRCGGRGRLDHYRHVANGVCFACDGSGKEGYARG
jgi:hypothetical protein